MNEITIGDKIYISSKRAAEITGYAKDYVGQLCREGHVDAKMVGRSWYVYEPSIRAHRFGKEEESTPEKPQIEPKAATEEIKAPESTWGAPKYTPEVPQSIPEMPKAAYEELLPPAQETLTDMQAAWREWFERKQQDLATPEIESPEVIDARNDAYVEEEDDEYEDDDEEIEVEAEEDEPEEEEIAVPLHRIDPPEEVVAVEPDEQPVPIRPIQPHVVHHEAPISSQMPLEGHMSAIPEARVLHERVIPRNVGKKRSRSSNAPIIALLTGLSVLAISIALVGTGLVDKYVQAYPTENPVIDFLVGKSEFKRQ
jgi:hypothetical protein